MPERVACPIKNLYFFQTCFVIFDDIIIYFPFCACQVDRSLAVSAREPFSSILLDLISVVSAFAYRA